ncbi:MAG: transcription-repair coupling factor [Chloroflexi bacterium]|nr:transcription-repair coupling factor [Chloroflexota bacterium]
MRLSGLLPLVRAAPGYSAIADGITGAVPPGSALIEAWAIAAARPAVVAALFADVRAPSVLLTARAEDAQRLHEQLQIWLGPEMPVLRLPEPDGLPYERLLADPATVRDRLRALTALADVAGDSRPPIVVASAHAVAAMTAAAPAFRRACHTIRVGDVLPLSDLLRRWVRMGYSPETAVEVPGAFSRRGGIVDIFSPASDAPVRIELFGDKVESLRQFDPLSQRSQQRVDAVVIMPAREALLHDAPLDARDLLARLAPSNLTPEARARLEEELGKLTLGPIDGMEHYLPLLEPGPLLDYLPQGGLLVLDEPARIRNALEEMADRAEELRETLASRGELPRGYPRPYYTWSELEAQLARPARRLVFRARRPGEGHGSEEGAPIETGFSAVALYGGRVKPFLADVLKQRAAGRRMVIASHQAQRLAELLREEGVAVDPVEDVAALPPPASLTLVKGSPREGFAMPGLALFTDAEVFGFTKQRRAVRPRPVKREAFLAELKVGDYVVHVEHGIGRFVGMVRRPVDGQEREFLVLDYAEGDKLYVPTEHIDRVAPYVAPGEAPPSLSRLGSTEWERTKERVRESARQVAKDLLAVYAAREVTPGRAFSPDTPWQQELEAAFPYVETGDQATTVQEVKIDMEKPRPMDRLVCGDVGFGKTEVAVRAAFKAVMDGRQVAVLVPTTVLAQQHFNTFRQRVAPFPVRIEMLSRFRSDREQEDIVRRLKSGEVDIVIGTHRLLQKDVEFQDLGLLIIDEEQRFGVLHKDRLKKLRPEVHVLALSATPIPRTLHMSLAGIRDLSTIQTPPEERLPIKTYVMEDSDQVIREAILREMDRGGQVFFVHNRVYNIEFIAERVRKLAPEATVAVAHGQMDEADLEKAMLDFYNGAYDVLVCTAIIESGLDIPNVNTLIVHDAHTFGLSQLHQLRGRVGRGAARAYAYFLTPPGMRLTEQAEKRLATIIEATELGAGFRIAMRDLEIRGAGNLLGVEQSGHIAAVGFDLYSRLLEEAVRELKAQQYVENGERPPAELLPQPPLPEVSLDLPLTAHIPEDYVPDVAARLGLYGRLVRARSLEDLEDVRQEMSDRFGPLPIEAQDLLYVVRVRLLAARAGVQAVSRQDGHIVLQLRDGIEADRAFLQRTYGTWVQVGFRQVRLDLGRLGDRWQKVLASVLSVMEQE